MSKRGRGEGSINKRASGSYTAQVTIEGRRVSKTFPNRKEAQDWIKKLNDQMQQGLTYSGSRTTVSELIDQWLKIKETKTRPATIESYQRLARKYIKEQKIGKLKLQEVNTARIQKLYSDLEAQGVGKRTIELTHTILHGFLSYAQRLGVVVQNWAELAEVPRPRKTEMMVWDESQVSQFLIANPDPFYRLALATGMRRGELIGLQWKDIDWNAGMIHVRRQVYELQGGGWIFQEPKTERGRRGIRVGKGLIEALREHFLVTIPQMRAIAGEAWQEYDLIFPSNNGKPRNGYSVSKKFHDLVTKTGLPGIRFHDMRHTAASIMLLHGEPPVRVAGILGQSVAVLLSTYAHYIQDDQERASNLMDEITTPAIIKLSAQSDYYQITTEKEKNE